MEQGRTIAEYILYALVIVYHVQAVYSKQCTPYAATHYIPMTYNDTTKILTGSTLEGTISGTVSSPAVMVGNGIALYSAGGFITLNNLNRSVCFHSPESCPNGFTISIVVFIHSNTIPDQKVYVSNGGESLNTTYGLTVMYVPTGKIRAMLSNTTHYWTALLPLSVSSASYVVSVTWDGTTMMFYAIEKNSGTVQKTSATSTERTITVSSTVDNGYYISKSSTDAVYGAAAYDELLFWEEAKNETFIGSLFTYEKNGACVVSCDNIPATATKFHSCYGCNLYWDCSIKKLYPCMHGYVFNDVTKACEASSATCPSIVTYIADNTLDCFPNSCESGPCQNNGSCVDMNDGWLCECNITAAGWTGYQCEANYDECQTSLNKCVWNNTASCTDGVGGLNNFTCACNPGYNLNDCSNLDNCLTTPCQNGGSCTDMVPDDNYTCACVPGYVGYNCETDFNECSSNPCQNGGLCNDQVNQYNCTCPPGFSGTHCELYDECYNSPCVNGTCLDSNQTALDNYVCTCTNGFSGQNCSIENECVTQNVNCLNGGVCQDLVGAWQCNCVPGYDGTYCGNNIDECATAPCVNGGTCTDLINDYNCTCVPGYVDTNCSTNFDECSSSPCQNSGTCTDLLNGFNCTCANGYSGSVCELYDECTATPCQSSATCTDPNLGVSNDYNCNCMPGFYGRSCENENGCVSQNVVCQNGGTCDNTTTAGAFTCQCVTGYNGTHCENNIDECSSNPCQNGGQCNDQVNQYNCTCSQGYFGTHCEILNECFAAPCQNGATCTDLVNDYSCTCAGQYTGKNCTQCTTGFSNPGCSVENECITQNVVCQNGGVCVDQVGSFLCSCAPGYKDTYCNITDECILYNNPCQNGGNCTDLTNDYSCACLNGYSGKNCTVDDKCITQSVTCLNGGACNPSDGSCSCTSNWLGTRCENDNPCYPNPCQYNGACSLLTGVGTYSCSCITGYSGVNCEVTPCTAITCQNNGSCTVDNSQYKCVCTSGFSGQLCQTKAADPSAAAQTADTNTGWKAGGISLIVIIIIIVIVVVVVVVVVVYKYKTRENKVAPAPDGENPPIQETHPAAATGDQPPASSSDNPPPAIAGGSGSGGGGADDWEGKEVELQHAPEEGGAVAGGSGGAAIGGAYRPIDEKKGPLQGPIINAMSPPPPKYEGPTPVSQ